MVSHPANPTVRAARLPSELPKIDLPAHEILEGTPDARLAFTAKTDRASAGFWSCDVGRYEFYFDYDEFMYVIEGELTVIQGEHRFTLRAGDTVHFPTGVTTIWEVTRRMTKYFVALG